MKQVAGLWEQADWTVEFDHQIERIVDSKQSALDLPCVHCRSESFSGVTSTKGVRLLRQVVTIPKVLVVQAVGGQSSTSLCLDCVLDGVKAVDETVDAEVKA